MSNVTMPACECGEREFTIDEQTLIDAGGWLECDVCARPLVPNGDALQNAAVTVAMDAMKGTRLAWGPSVWFAEITRRVAEIRATWNKNYEAANAK
jgi:hypothetical protein